MEETTVNLTQAAEFAGVRGTGTSTDVAGSVGEDGVLRCVNLGYCICVVVRDGTAAKRI